MKIVILRLRLEVQFALFGVNLAENQRAISFDGLSLNLDSYAEFINLSHILLKVQ